MINDIKAEIIKIRDKANEEAGKNIVDPPISGHFSDNSFLKGFLTGLDKTIKIIDKKEGSSETEEEDYGDYYSAVLKDGSVIHFDKLCFSITQEGSLIHFNDKYGNCLSIIPTENVWTIYTHVFDSYSEFCYNISTEEELW